MLNIRQATPEDAGTLFGYVYDLAKFEHSEQQVRLTENDYHRFLEEGGHFDGLIAEVDGSAVGMAIWYKRFSTWVGDYIHLEDIYVDKQHRGQGIARKLIHKLGATAAEQGLQRIELMVLNWNENAIELYKSLGATTMPEWVLCQFSEGAVLELAHAAEA